jgi:glycosyltransferase involved in cell wall biosynthesis
MTGKTKIAIDISPLSNGHSQRGIGYFTKQFVNAALNEAQNNPQFRHWQIDLIEDPSLDLSSYSLIHYPFFDIFRRTLPSRPLVPFIVTVHDLIPLEFSAHYPLGIRGNINWIIQKSRLAHANLLITISHYSKFVINDITRYPLDRIYVTYGAADNHFRPINNRRLLKKIKDKYHLPDKFILYLGDINWNKNVPSLVKACLRLNFPLVIVGAAALRSNVINHPWNQDLLWLQKQFADPQNQGLLYPTGFVPEEDLPAFFNLARLYCQPSFAEGFGLPVVQAMQSGCPVLSSNTSCLPEITSNAALQFDPHSLTDLVDKLDQLISSTRLRRQFITQGLRRSQDFNWSRTGLQTLAVYQLAMQHD